MSSSPKEEIGLDELNSDLRIREPVTEILSTAASES
tara:strand:- start:57 stop:164 length:108 start_codon:yes stop_codon:yes gene_type:complete